MKAKLPSRTWLEPTVRLGRMDKVTRAPGRFTAKCAISWSRSKWTGSLG